MERVLRGETVFNYETFRQRKDGTLLEVSMVASPVRDAQGNIVGKSCIIYDISERRRLEREFRRLDRLDLSAQLAAGIGHEIRNPLTTVRGFLQFLGMKPDLQAEKEYFQLMIDEIDRANSIITEFLSLAKGKPVDRRMCCLNEIVQHLAPLIQADVSMQGHVLQLELAEVPPVLLEEKDIRQLLLNLVRNGLEAMPQEGQLTIRTRSLPGEVRLEVSDQGSGIPLEHLDKIYLPFYTTKDSGTGLGLPVCYRIADQHGASIEIDTGEQGTTFSVVFPLKNEDEPSNEQDR
jgi:signal transduction histidine kinase